MHFDAGGAEGQLGRGRYKLPLEYTEGEGFRYERDARTQPNNALLISDEMEDRHLPTEATNGRKEFVFPKRSP